MRRVSTALLLVCLGCRGGVNIDVSVGGVPSGPPKSMRIDGLPSTLDVGAVTQIRAVLTYADGTGIDAAEVSLSSSAPAIASADSATREVRALAKGDAVITARLPADAGAQLEASAPVHVQNPGADITVQIEVAPSHLTLAPGLGAQLQANATQADGSQKSVTALAVWSTSDGSVCTVDTKGFVTAVQPGACAVTAAYAGFTSSAQVTVAALTVTAMSIAPSAVVVPKGQTARLTATVTLSDGSARDATATATWTSSDAAIAPVSAGVVSGLAVGTATITAAAGGQTAQASVRVDAAAITGISVTPPDFTLALGLQQQCRATAVFADGTTADVTLSAAWSSDAPAIAGVSGGLVTTVAKGRAKITATVANVSGVALVNVTDATLVRLSLLPPSLNLPLGTSFRLHAAGVFSDHTGRDVSLDATWSVDDPSVATVDATGLVAGLAKGQTSVSAALLGQQAVAPVTVTDATLVKLLVLPQSAVLPLGGTTRLNAQGVYSDNTLHDVTAQATWSTSDATVADVSNATRGLVTAAGQGTAQISAALGGVTSNASAISVIAATLVGVRLQPGRLLLPQYLTLPVRLFARYSDGSEFDETQNATFVSDHPEFASVVATAPGAGLVTGISRGAATVTGSLQGFSGTAAVNVVDAQLQSLTVTVMRNSMKVGDAQQLRAIASYTGARLPVDVTALCTWTSSTPGVARFDLTPPGLLVAVSPGTMTASAELSGVVGTHDVTVSALTPAKVEVLAAAFTLPVGLTRTLIAKATYTDGSTADVTFGSEWASDANAVAVVGNTSLLKGIVSAVSPGAAHISATVGGVSGSSTATIDDAHPTGLTISPVDTVVTSGGGPFRPTTVNYSATARFDDGNDYNVTGLASWFSSDPTVAAISNIQGSKGRADVIAIGVTTITATYAGFSAATTLTSR